MIFVHGIELLTFTEKLREIGAGPKFALYLLTRTANQWYKNNAGNFNNPVVNTKLPDV